MKKLIIKEEPLCDISITFEHRFDDRDELIDDCKFISKIEQIVESFKGELLTPSVRKRLKNALDAVLDEGIEFEYIPLY